MGTELRSAENSFASGVLGFNSGAEFEIFSTALRAFRDFIAVVEPPIIQFTGDAKSSSRVRLYKSFARRFARDLQEMGYRSTSVEHEFAPVNDKESYATFTYCNVSSAA